MPSGVYSRATAKPRGRPRLIPIEPEEMSAAGGPSGLRSEVSLLGATAMVKELVQKIATLVRFYPRVIENVPHAAALANGHAVESENAKRVNQPLRPAPSASKSEKLSAYMRQRWAAARDTGDMNPKTGKPTRFSNASVEVNPKTGKPYVYSAARRAEMAKTQRRLMKNPKRRRQNAVNMKKAIAARWAGQKTATPAKKTTLSPAQLRQRQAAAATMREKLAAKRNGTARPLQSKATRAKVGNATKQRWALARKLGWTARPGVSSPPMAELQALQRARDAAADTLTSQPDSPLESLS